MKFVKGVNPKPYLVYSIIAALLYNVPLIFFINRADFSDAWLLYLGNFLFMLMVGWFLMTFNFKRDENAGTLVMFTASSITTVIGAIFAVLVSLFLILVLVPGIFQPGLADKVLVNEPAQSVDGKTNGLVFMVLVNAVFGNVFCGMFVSIIFPFALKGDQTREKVPRKKQAEL
ncbi:MAG: hypothetical protein EOO04_03990 [Chitinophagaceae bacterium]|nr:MAG: hypothetical protein EOO04_03990 [Chitinophagaceae bacterium]